MTDKKQSPDYAKMSHATAISLGLMHNRMYRGAVNRCVNLLVHYPEGCSANCAYCGLAKKRPGTYGEKSFIHVEWPLFSMAEIIDAVNRAPGYVKRTCISMITNGKCKAHTLHMTEQLTRATKLPVSILTSPTILDMDFLHEAKRCGADKIGVALDLATPALFDKYRGKEVSGPHRWETYWQFLKDGLSVFGTKNVGAHLMVGMGETEKEMEIECETPGVCREDIELDILHNEVVIRGKRGMCEGREDDGYHRRERSFGEFNRRVKLPVAV